MEMGAEDIMYLRDYFTVRTKFLRLNLDLQIYLLYQTDPNPVTRSFHKKKLSITKNRKKAYFTAEEGLKKVQKGDFAFMIDLMTANKIIEVTKSDFS